MPKIAILLATYNGEKYLAEQLDSLLSQTYQNTIIVVRDDGSSDNSIAVVKSYAEKYPKQFHVLPSDTANQGASGSFALLMRYVLDNKSLLGLSQAYMMFCDQDDVWFENKVQTQVDAMQSAEASSTVSEKPLLIHCDLEVVSSRNKLIAPSLIAFQGLEIHRNRFPNLVISNLVTGCTALINEALARKSLPIADNAIMHDWWVALVAAAFGQVIFLDQALIHYRQHENNTIGAKEFVTPAPTSRSFWERVFARKPNEHLVEVGIQAAEFRRRFGKELSSRDNLGLFVSARMQIKIGSIQRIFYRLARRF